MSGLGRTPGRCARQSGGLLRPSASAGTAHSSTAQPAAAAWKVTCYGRLSPRPRAISSAMSRAGFGKLSQSPPGLILPPRFRHSSGLLLRIPDTGAQNRYPICSTGEKMDKRHRSHGTGAFSPTDFRSLAMTVCSSQACWFFTPRRSLSVATCTSGTTPSSKGTTRTKCASDETWIGQQCFFHSAGGLTIGRAWGSGWRSRS